MKDIDRKTVETLISLALNEDIGPGDITSEAIFTDADFAEARIISKDTGIFCGADMLKYVYEMVDLAVKIDLKVKEGAHIKFGDTVALISGHVVSLLKGERTALNFMQRMSGIATKTASLVSLLEGTETKILDTRKTLPGFRMLDKYAVKCGGGENHRTGLYDMVLIKDNHIKAAGSITEAVKKVRQKHGREFKIEVETSTIDEVREAVSSDVEIIMLDNMEMEMVREAVKIISGRCKIELSGNMDEKKIESFRGVMIDYISVGMLTHSVKAFDFSMRF